jgi:hypothetical protein
MSLFRSMANAWRRMFARKDDYKALLMADLGIER